MKMTIRAALLAGVAVLAAPVVSGGVVLDTVLGVSAAHADSVKTPAVAKALKAAQDSQKAGDFAGALAKAREADAASGKSAYETYVTNQFIAFLSFKQKDYKGAAKAYEAMLASGKMPANERGPAIKTLAQIYYQVGNSAKASQYVKQYQTEIGSDAELEALTTQGAYQGGDYRSAVASSKALAKQAQAAGRRPQEAVLQIWLASAFKLGDKASQREALTMLVENYPSPTYWSDLLDVTQADIGRSDRLGLEVFRLRVQVGAMQTSDDYVEMAQLAIQNGLPGEAQSVMERGFSGGKLGGANKSRETRLLTMAKTQAAQDKASLPQSAGSGTAKAKLAEAYATYGNPGKAIELYKAASGAENPDEVKLHLGQAYLAQGNKAEARRAFGSVNKNPAYKALASLWMAATNR